MSIVILIVDDDPNFKKILKLKVLSLNTNKIIEKKISVKEVSTISEAKDFLKIETPDLVLLDQHLPDGLGSELIESNEMLYIPVISLSSDDSPELPATNIKKGAKLFIPKADITKAYFLPLLEAIISKADSEAAIRKSEELRLKLETVQTLTKTLNHEINNPLGVLYGAEFILQSESTTKEEKDKALLLIKESTTRIKNILQELSNTTELQVADKGGEELFNLANDTSWKTKN